MAPQEREAFRKGFEDGIVRSGNLFQQIAWDSHRIRRVEEIVDGRLLVYVRHYDNEINVTHNIRWWLLPDGDGGWKAYDFEDVSFGLSAVGLMGSLARNALAADPVPWVEQVVRLGRTMQDWDPDDEAGTAALTALLDEIGTQDMPLEFRRYVSVVRATFHLQRGDPSASIRELDAAIQAGHAGLQHDYVRGQAMLSARRYEDALSALQRYADQVGWDSDVLEAVSDAHLMLGNRELAREAALRGLADNPSAVHCLASLAAASEVDQIRQPSFREHFHRSGMADTGYEVALDYLLDLERLPQAHALFARFKEDFPDHPLLSFYTEELSGK
jgi:tetratricopeptide (TPR) repeat protein